MIFIGVHTHHRPRGAGIGAGTEANRIARPGEIFFHAHFLLPFFFACRTRKPTMISSGKAAMMAASISSPTSSDCPTSGMSPSLPATFRPTGAADFPINPFDFLDPLTRLEYRSARKRTRVLGPKDQPLAL